MRKFAISLVLIASLAIALIPTSSLEYSTNNGNTLGHGIGG